MRQEAPACRSASNDVPVGEQGIEQVSKLSERRRRDGGTYRHGILQIMMSKEFNTIFLVTGIVICLVGILISFIEKTTVKKCKGYSLFCFGLMVGMVPLLVGCLSLIKEGDNMIGYCIVLGAIVVLYATCIAIMFRIHRLRKKDEGLFKTANNTPQQKDVDMFSPDAEDKG